MERASVLIVETEKEEGEDKKKHFPTLDDNGEKKSPQPHYFSGELIVFVIVYSKPRALLRQTLILINYATLFLALSVAFPPLPVSSREAQLRR